MEPLLVSSSANLVLVTNIDHQQGPPQAMIVTAGNAAFTRPERMSECRHQSLHASASSSRLARRRTSFSTT